MLEQETQAWSIRDLMKFAIDHLQKHGFDESRLTVELLLSDALQCQRIELYTHFDKPLSHEELRSFRQLYDRRLAREPVQYIVGATSFMGLQFTVDRRVFIPRPETETLVEQVMMKCNQRSEAEEAYILDVGTGSGNVAVSLAKLLKKTRITGIDRSVEALQVAEINARAHRVIETVTFEKVDFFEPLESRFPQRFDFLVSNPPYVSIQEWQDLAPEIRDFEPKQAVSDQNDGYEFHRRIGEVARQLVRQGGWVIVEVGHGQAGRVSQMFRAAGFTEIDVVNDLQGISRIVLGKCP